MKWLFLGLLGYLGLQAFKAVSAAGQMQVAVAGISNLRLTLTELRFALRLLVTNITLTPITIDGAAGTLKANGTQIGAFQRQQIVTFPANSRTEFEVEVFLDWQTVAGMFQQLFGRLAVTVSGNLFTDNVQLPFSTDFTLDLSVLNTTAKPATGGSGSKAVDYAPGGGPNVDATLEPPVEYGLEYDPSDGTYSYAQC